MQGSLKMLQMQGFDLEVFVSIDRYQKSFSMVENRAVKEKQCQVQLQE